MAVKRRRFQGMLNILSFNRHFYFAGLGALAIISVTHAVYSWSDLWFAVVIAAFAYGLLMPLIVSAYVYDFAGYYNFSWLKNCAVEPRPHDLVNINAGFDETSFIIAANFPGAELHVFDFYNAKQHTEPAIIRARKVSNTFPGTRQIATAHIPMADNSADVIFLLSAAHEIRSHAEKIMFLKECRRVCRPAGKIVMAEHLRDFPNFLAFTIGFTHFFSARTWKDAYIKAGFTDVTQKKFTPFMSVFTIS